MPPMTERGLPIVDGAPACPFVAFEDDRDGRASAPDHRHRCFAEPRPAPRALAHQEAYCLASAFPVCPTFQDWARREAAAARPASAPPRPAPPVEEPPVSRPMPPLDREPRHPSGGEPQPLPPRRNPPRSWAAPPPWSGDEPTGGVAAPPPFLAGRGEAEWGSEARGLAGSAADRLAGPDPDVPAPVRRDRWGPPAPEPDEDEEASAAASRPAPARRPVREQAHREPEELFGPAWERPRRYEAYPSLRTRIGLPSLGVSRLGVAALALVLAAVALFFMGPMLLGFGVDDPGSRPVASPTPVTDASPTPLPTEPPAPTPQVYVVASGDTMSRIAKRFGITVEQLLQANPQIRNPDRITVGDELVIPPPLPDEVSDGGEVSSEP